MQNVEIPHKHACTSNVSWVAYGYEASENALISDSNIVSILDFFPLLFKHISTISLLQKY